LDPLTATCSPRAADALSFSPGLNAVKAAMAGTDTAEKLAVNAGTTRS
jgi:hypothetical protein